MSDAVEIWERPEAEEIYLFVGWRQWADGGSVSSGLPQYLVKQLNARQIGELRSDGFYLFQFPGTHDLVRPVVKFTDGYPDALQTQRNELFYAGDNKLGIAIFLGDEPHMDVDRYVSAILYMVETLKVKRVIGLGGVYGELPYDKERIISSTYSLPHLKDEIGDLAVNLSDYHGGASIGSYLCRRAGEKDIEYVAFYAFVPTYDFSNISQLGNTIRIENDYMAWLGVMKRVNYMLKLNIDLADLEEKSDHLIEVVEAKAEELDSMAPQLGVRDYLKRLSDEFTETSFTPLDDVWEDELRRLFDRLDPDDE
jgi:proteasome assembly chaperone (PAC2) family protein